MNLRHKAEACGALVGAAFFGRRFPLAVSYIITDRCNFRCAYCHRWKRDTEGELSTAEVFSVLDELRAMGTRLFKVTGGEPFLRPDLEEVVRRASECGFHVGLNTNGSLIDSAPNVLNYVNMLSLSLDGPPEVHEKIRPAGAFAAVMRAIDAARERGIGVMLNATLTRYNTHCVDYLVDLAGEKGVGIRFQPASAWVLSGTAKDPVVADREEIIRALDAVCRRARRDKQVKNWPFIVKFMKQWPRGQGITCAGGRLFCRIESRGEVLVCGRRRHPDAVYPNVRQGGVRDAFNRMALPTCDMCYNHTRLRINVLYSLLKGNRRIWRAAFSPAPQVKAGRTDGNPPADGTPAADPDDDPALRRRSPKRIFPVPRRIVHLYPGVLWDAARLLARVQFLDGPQRGEFEREFAAHVGARHAMATGTGRLALRLLLEAFDLPKGSEVIISAYEDASVPEAVQAAGLMPVCVDIDRRTQNISLDGIREALSAKTSTVIAGHLFGNPFDVPALAEMVRGCGIRIIEDCAHAVGTTLGGRQVGGFGDAAIFSFHTTKPFMTFGGGMAVTNDDAVARKVRERLNGLPFPPRARLARRLLLAFVTAAFTSRPGFALAVYPLLRLTARLNIGLIDIYNRTLRKVIKIEYADTRYTNFQAQVGLRNLARLPDMVARRRAHIVQLDGVLGGKVDKPLALEGSNGYFYTVYCRRRDDARKRLLRAGIDAGKQLMRNCAAALGQADRCPNTARVIEESIQIPIHATLSGKAVARMGRIVADILTAMENE